MKLMLPSRSAARPVRGSVLRRNDRQPRRLGLHRHQSEFGYSSRYGGFMFRIDGRRTAAILASIATFAALTACGAKTTDDAAPAAGAAIDTAGDTVKVGLLNSLSGTM